MIIKVSASEFYDSRMYLFFFSHTTINMSLISYFPRIFFGAY